MAKLIDLTGQKFGRLTVVKKLGHYKGNALWLCECECGNKKIVRSDALRSNRIRSCGCLKKEQNKINLNQTKHNKENTRLYSVWVNIKTRCYNKNNKTYKYYGQRGISLCKEWKEDFMSFYNWAFANGYDENAKRGVCTIDRIDVNGNYEPKNCRWISIQEQQKNKRNKYNNYMT